MKMQVWECSFQNFFDALCQAYALHVKTWIQASEVKILWEGRKIWKNLPPVLAKQLFLLSSVKTSGRFFQIFVAFSEKLDITT